MTHYGYPDQQASWWFYILRGVEGVVLFSMLAPAMRYSVIGGLAVWWGLFEEAQTAVCGYLAMGAPNGDNLCLQAIGPFPYALMLSALFVWWWGRDRKN